MASSSGGSYASSQETTNFARLCRIVVDVLRDILWQVLIQEIPAADLPNRVRMNQKKLAKLDAKINTWLCGISPSSPEIPIAEKFDVTSLYTLIRNLCSQVPNPSTQWGQPPPQGGTTLGDDIERVREFRNSLYGHATQAKIDTADFNNLCIEIRNVVSRFDVYFSSKAMKCDFKSEIDVILTCSMDKSLQDTYIDKMKEIAVLSDDLEKVNQKVSNVQEQVVDVKHQFSIVQEQVVDVKQQVSNVQEQVVDVKHQFSNVQEQVVDVKQQVRNVQEQFVDVKQEVSNVQEQFVDVKQEVSNVQEQFVDVKQEVSNVQELVVDVKQEVRNVQEQFVDVKQEVRNVQEQFVDVKQRVTNVQEQVVDVKHHFSNVQEQFVDVKQEVRNVQEQVVDVKHIAFDVNQQVGDVECQVSILKEQFVQHVMEQVDINAHFNKEIEEIKETLAKKPDVVEKSKHFRKGVSCMDPNLLYQILNKSVQVASSSLSTLKENCRRVGLKFHGETPRNGNCFFEAVSSQLQRLNCPEQISPQQLRKDVIAFMKTNRILRVSEGTIDLAEFIHDENFDDYCARISRDGEWADHVVVLGMARMIRTDIMIITSLPSSDPDSHIAWVVGQANFQGDPILLGHEFEQHYQSLQPIENLQANEFGLESDGSKEAISLDKSPSQSVQVGEQTSTVKMAVSSVPEGYSDTEADKQVIPEEILRMDEGSIQMFKEALRDRKEKVYNIRVMIVGRYRVGKTTLSKRLLGDDVNISERESTEGIDVHIHRCRVSRKTGEWLKQDKDAEEAYKVQRYVKLLNDQSQGLDISDEQTGNTKVMHQMETPLHVKEVDTQHVRSGNLGKDQKTLKSSSKPSNASDEDRSSDEDTNTLKTSSKGDKENSSGNIVREDIHKMLEQSARNAAKSDNRETVKNIIKFVTENADKLVRSREEHSPLAMWDFAGQYIYYTTHQTFLSQRAIYLLVIDLTQGFTDHVEDDDYFFDIEGKKECLVHELAELWLNSIHSCAPFLESGSPPVILVGTHADKIPKERCEDVLLEIRNHYLKGRPALVHLADEDFSIDNTIVDPKLKDLQKKIVELASQQQHWGESIPARWLILEERLMSLKANDVKVIPYYFLEEINQEGDVRIDSKEELDLFLKYQHDIGNILYFSTKDLREWIILEPQWLIKAMKSLITDAKFILKKHPQAAKEWCQFKEEGKLTHELLDIVWSEKHDPDLYNYKTLILLLMEQLNIVARPRLSTKDGDKVEDFFLAPCMLREKTPRDVISPATKPEVQSSSVLCFVFVEKFLPSPIFHRLLALCIAKWPILKKRKTDQIFCGCGVFEITDVYRLTLYFKSYIIFARVTLSAKHQTLDAKVCIPVRDFLNYNLSKILGNLSQNLKFELFIQCQCPESVGDCLDSIFPVNKLNNVAELTCRYHDDRSVESNSLLKYWFQNEVEINFLSHCILREATSEVVLPQPYGEIGNTPVLCFILKEQFIPSFIFHRLVTDCVAQWPIAKKRSENLIFYDCCLFDLDLQHRLTVFFRKRVIFVRVTRMGDIENSPSYKLCIEAKEFITRNLTSVIGYLGESLQFELSIQCPKSDGYNVNCLIPVADLQANVKVSCHCHHEIYMSNQLLKFWFHEEIKPSYKKIPERQLGRLAAKIGHKYVLLGLNLGLNEADIQKIQEDYPNTVIQCLMMLFKWKLQNGDKATFRNLKQTLQTADIDVDILKLFETAEDNVSCLPPEMLDKHPQDGHLGQICSMIGTGHVLLGVELEVPLSRINQILREHQDNLQRQCFEILKEWKGREALTATYRNLEKAFKCIGINPNILKQSVN